MGNFLHSLFLVFATFFAKVQPFVPESELFPYNQENEVPVVLEDDKFYRYEFQVPFTFFNTTYNSTFVSGNGQISFGQGNKSQKLNFI